MDDLRLFQDVVLSVFKHISIRCISFAGSCGVGFGQDLPKMSPWSPLNDLKWYRHPLTSDVCSQDDDFAGHPDARRFYHCPTCWEDGIKEDRCYFCSSAVVGSPQFLGDPNMMEESILQDGGCC